MKYKGCGSNTSSAIFLSSFLPRKQKNKQTKRKTKQTKNLSQLHELFIESVAKARQIKS